MELICLVQNYDWGPRGSESLVAAIAYANSNIDIVEDRPYAEFWMGTHPNGPSVLKATKVPLSMHIKENPLELGMEAIDNFGHDLPFLFKILSVKKALSIQVHPSKVQAKYLFESVPSIYKDSNHKPEMAIALTEFKALCSFRPLKEIKFYVENVPEFNQLIGKEKIDQLLNCDPSNEVQSTALMKDCFQSLLLCDNSVVKAAVNHLAARLEESSEKSKCMYYYDLIVKLKNDFPGDVGIFCIYWLNYVTLNSGEAMYLAPNEPHAYLCGDCIECMANSDNVLRAGLTSKYRDVPTLCQLLSYKCCPPTNILFSPVKESEFSLLFSPPVKEFAVAKITIPENDEYTIPKRKSASLMVVVEGKGLLSTGQLVKTGSVFYVPCGEELKFKSEEILTIFQAFLNITISS